ncbi:hypothetical protein GKO46_13140 [SAR202 cluster bacterium JH702]|uniref:Uncharacterized protein n=1 Tax=Candidatus Lucifugimonas marina TaxID=3038979 RepID=A0ABD4XU95_9CHLR|nr:hypothetical protein [SAR202 cluster bacterium JH702]
MHTFGTVLVDQVEGRFTYFCVGTNHDHRSQQRVGVGNPAIPITVGRNNRHDSGTMRIDFTQELVEYVISGGSAGTAPL